MQLLVTLRKTKNIEKLKNACDGFIVGSLFSSGYNYSLNDLVAINKYCKNNAISLYVSIDDLISETEKPQLKQYFDFLSKLEIDGIYFHDLAIYNIAKTYNLENKLIYDGYTMICNSLDVQYYLSKGINGVVLSREITLDEIKNIITINPMCCDIMIFGHSRLSYSKRKFLTNYFREIKSSYDYMNTDSLRLVEEKRDYKMPIIEDSSGTKIYTDYILQMYKELPDLKAYVKRGIVDSIFVEDDKVLSVLRDYKRISNENAEFLFDGLNLSYPDNYSTGFLYQKTNITKDE